MLAIRLQEPLAWKGGMLAELLKKTGNASNCSDHRGILISDASGKLWHTSVRASAKGIFSKEARDTQYAGVAHRGTDFCSLAVKSYFCIAEGCKKSAVALFVDVIGAFDTLIRRYVCDERADDIRVIAVLQALGLPPSVLHEFIASIQEDSISVLPSLGAQRHLAAIIEDTLSCTWHTIQGCGEVTEPVTGCKPATHLQICCSASSALSYFATSRPTWMPPQYRTSSRDLLTLLRKSCRFTTTPTLPSTWTQCMPTMMFS